MCEDTAEFTTITGPRDRIEWLMGHWKELRFVTGEPLPERDIRIRWYDLAGELGEAYRDPACGAVAVALHPKGEAARTAASLIAAFDLVDESGSLRCEAGHTFAGDAAPGGGPALLDPVQVARALPLIPVLPKQPGSRVALLDTGVDVAAGPMVDLTAGWPLTGIAPHDPHGHGSSVAQAIRAQAPHADIMAIRVLGPSNKGSSLTIYQGLIAALWDGQGCDVVNASFGVDATNSCGTALGATFSYLMTLRARIGYLRPPPVLVVAAGNNRTTLRSPATADGAYVVPATDFNGVQAPYCAQLVLGSGVISYPAPGGIKGDPLGHYSSGAEVYGTSFAAGFVSGALLG